jgi:hypothetical protein
MVHVAFFRNLNLGQTRTQSPTRTVLEDAFATAGVAHARSFQTNGTVLFEPLGRPPAQVMVSVLATSGYADIAPTQPLAEVAALVAAVRLRVDIDRSLYATFFDRAGPQTWALPGAQLDGLGTTVVASGPGWVATHVAPGGDPTSAVQARLGQRATTRGFGTLEKLLAAAGR